MNDNEFLKYIYNYAAGLKKTPLTESEKKSILDEFNKTQGDAFARAQGAVKKIIGKTLVEADLSKSANLDNTKRLLSDLRAAAATWVKK